MNDIIRDYPFLKRNEHGFVHAFLKAHGRYPVFYIAIRYMMRSESPYMQTFVRVNGINGPHETTQALAKEYGLSTERVRQMSKLYTSDKRGGRVWDIERWTTLPFFDNALLTEASTHWAEVQWTEQVDRLDFHAALNIIAALRRVEVVALRADGYRANSKKKEYVGWEQPVVLFAYDAAIDYFAMTKYLQGICHEAQLQRRADKQLSLSHTAEPHLRPGCNEAQRRQVYDMLREVLPMIPNVATDGDTITLRQNHTDYVGDILQILQHSGKAMTVEEIYAEFRNIHPYDHHTNSNFIRSYLLQNKQFEAIGRKSTYQLREWNHFAGSLQQLAAHLLANEPEPLPQEEMTRRMMAQRPATTAKSCATSIYLAMQQGLLQYYFTNDDNTPTAYVGLAGRDYPQRYWLSTLTVEGTVASMHRFISERGHWPFATASDPVEERLHYTMRKFAQRQHVSPDEYARYQEGMADIPPHKYPTTKRHTYPKDATKSTNASSQTTNSSTIQLTMDFT